MSLTLRTTDATPHSPVPLVRHCPLCHSTMGYSLVRIEFEPAVEDLLPNDFSVVLCAHCQFCFDDISASQPLIDQYYQGLEKYAHAQTGGSGGSEPVDLKRWERITSLLSPYLKPSSRILDIGSGKGGLLRALRQLGYPHVVAIEPSASCRYVLVQQDILAYANMEDALAHGEQFDCLLCCQVLEHIYDLSGFMQKAKSLCRPGAILYADVPDASCYVLNSAAAFYYFDREHINHFTRATLQHLFTLPPSAWSILSVTNYEEAAIAEGKKNHGLSILCSATPLLSPATNADDPDAASLIDYCQRSSQADDYSSLSDIRAEAVFLWGLGYYVRRLLRKGVFKHLPVKGIIDRDKGDQGQTFASLPIYSQTILNTYPQSQSCVIISSVLYADAIRHSLLASGYTGTILDITKGSAHHA